MMMLLLLLLAPLPYLASLYTYLVPYVLLPSRLVRPLHSTLLAIGVAAAHSQGAVDRDPELPPGID